MDLYVFIFWFGGERSGDTSNPSCGFTHPAKTGCNVPAVGFDNHLLDDINLLE